MGLDRVYVEWDCSTHEMWNVYHKDIKIVISITFDKGAGPTLIKMSIFLFTYILNLDVWV